MELVKTQSKRLRNNDTPFVDYFLKWEYQGKTYLVRVMPCFPRDYKFFYTTAKEC